jgi:hypothetical protein
MGSRRRGLKLARPEALSNWPIAARRIYEQTTAA